MHARRERPSDAGPGGTLADVVLPGQPEGAVTEEEWVALVRGVAAGDQLALHALYERTHRLVFTLAVRLTRDREMAEELTVDAFHSVWRAAASFDPSIGTVVGWIMSIARSRAIDRLRYEGRKKRVGAGAEDAAPPGAGEGPEEALETKQGAQLLLRALSQLTPLEREAIETAFFSGLTYEETAVRLETPVGTIKTRIRSGLSKLRQALAEESER